MENESDWLNVGPAGRFITSHPNIFEGLRMQKDRLGNNLKVHKDDVKVLTDRIFKIVVEEMKKEIK